MSAALLDTHVVIALMEGLALRPAARSAIAVAAAAGALHVSVVSAWEVGLLARPSKPLHGRILPDPLGWFNTVLAQPGMRLAALTPEIAIASSFLPGELHGDPADRLLVATSLAIGAPLITKDRAILEFAQSGGVRAVPA